MAIGGWVLPFEELDKTPRREEMLELHVRAIDELYNEYCRDAEEIFSRTILDEIAAVGETYPFAEETQRKLRILREEANLAGDSYVIRLANRCFIRTFIQRCLEIFSEKLRKNIEHFRQLSPNWSSLAPPCPSAFHIDRYIQHLVARNRQYMGRYFRIEDIHTALSLAAVEQLGDLMDEQEAACKSAIERKQFPAWNDVDPTIAAQRYYPESACPICWCDFAPAAGPDSAVSLHPCGHAICRDCYLSLEAAVLRKGRPVAVCCSLCKQKVTGASCPPECGIDLRCLETLEPSVPF